MSKIRFIGLDVHAETIAVAVAEPGGEVRSVGIIPNRLESVRKLVGKLGPVQHLKVCYEAGPTGYVLYWPQTALSKNQRLRVGQIKMPKWAKRTCQTHLSYPWGCSFPSVLSRRIKAYSKRGALS